MVLPRLKLKSIIKKKDKIKIIKRQPLGLQQYPGVLHCRLIPRRAYHELDSNLREDHRAGMPKAPEHRVADNR